MSRRQQLLIETHATRQQAADLLRTLEETRKQIEQQLAGEKREDVVKLVTGRSSIDSAIAMTRRMIETLDRAITETRNTPAEDDQTAAEAESAEPEVHILGRIRLGKIVPDPAKARTVVGR